MLSPSAQATDSTPSAHLPSTSTTSSASSPVPPLPVETLSAILKLVTEDLPHLERQLSSFAFSKVSRAWYHASKHDLVDCVVDGSRRALKLCDKTDEEKKVVGHASRRIGSLVLLDEGKPTTGRGEALARLIGKVPAILSLTIVCQDPFGMDNDVLGVALQNALARLAIVQSFTLPSTSNARFHEKHLRQ